MNHVMEKAPPYERATKADSPK